jgi:hypothetical protein
MIRKIGNPAREVVVDASAFEEILIPTAVVLFRLVVFTVPPCLNISSRYLSKMFS